MNAAMYPDADQTAPAMPTMNRMPAAPRLRCRFWIALAKIWWTDPGASLLRLAISGWSAEVPISPRIETSAMIAGKMASTP